MKPAIALAAGLCLSAATGIFGFWLGKSSSSPPSSAASQEPADDTSRSRAPRPAMSRVETQALAALLERESDPLKRFSIALENMEGWIAADPVSALAWLSRQPITARRNEVIRLALFQWAESDPGAAATWSNENLEGTELNNMLIRLAEQWVEVDPVSAARWFSQLPVGPSRLGPLEGMFFRWATADPSAARGFIERELPADPNTHQLLQAIHAGWAKTDPHAAVASSLAASKQFENPGIFAITLANWATVDVASSAAWLSQNVQPGPARSAAVEELAGMFAHHDPSSGLAWLDQLTPEERTPARHILAVTWAEADAASAAQWLASQPALDLDPDATSTILIGFHSRNPEAFAAWRDSLPPGPLKQQATDLSDLPEDEE